MKQFLTQLLFTLSLLTLSHVMYATTLGLGDIVITGYNSDNNDEFSFVLLKDISGTTVISFTDRGWKFTGGFNSENNDGTFTWTITDSYSCGAEFRMRKSNSDQWYAHDETGDYAGDIDGSNQGEFSLSSSGDQIFVYNGSSTPTSGSDTDFITAFDFNGNNTSWDYFSYNDNTSALPSIFSSNPGNSFAVSHKDNGKFDCEGGSSITSGEPANLKANIYTASNWDFSNSNRYDFTNFCDFSCSTSCTPFSITSVSGGSGIFCPGSEVSLEVNGSLNEDEKWVWYTGSCGGSKVGEGSTLMYTVNSSTTFYVRGEGTCSETSGSCTTVDITVEDTTDPIAVCKDLTVDFNGEEEITLSSSQVWNEDASSDNCGAIHFVGTDPSLDISCESVGEIVSMEVTIMDGSGNEGKCTSHVTVTGLPCGWTEGLEDGSLNCGSNTSVDFDAADKTFTLTADGCWQEEINDDKATFVYQALCGDGQLQARLASINSAGYAGLMAYESIDPKSRRAGALKNTSTQRVRREYRATYGGNVIRLSSNRSNVKWFRIVRKGNKIKSYTSKNGYTWSLLYEVTYPNLEDCMYFGMMAYSLNGSAEVDAVFDNVSFSSSGNVSGVVNDDTSIYDDLHANTTVGNIGNGNMIISPNPASSEIQIRLDGFQDKPAQIMIRDNFGRVIHQIDLDSALDINQSISVSDLAVGIYMISVMQDQQPLITKKLVIQP